MKKLTKTFAILSFVFMALFLFASCDKEYNFYEDWHEAGADIEEDNIYKVITLDEAKEKISNGDKFVLIYAASKIDNVVNYDSVELISTFQVQAEYLGNTTATIYVLDSSKYTSKDDRKLIRETLNMHEAPSNGSPVVLVYNKVLEVDTSNKNGNNGTKSKDFLVNGSYSYASLASYVFLELLPSNAQ